MPATATRWDLSPIIPSLDSADTRPVFDQLEEATRAVEAFKGRLETIDRDGVAEAIDALGTLQSAAQRLGYRGQLAFSEDTTDDAARTFMETVRTASTDAGNRVRFLTHWIKELPDQRAAELRPDDGDLAYFFDATRKERPYMLPQEIEQVIAEKDMTGSSAVRQAREIFTSSLRFKDPKTGELTTQSQLSTYAHSPDGQLRRKAYDEMYNVYGQHGALLSHLYRSIVRDWGHESLNMRGYPRHDSPRNLANDVSDEVIDAMLGVCREKRGLWQRYFEWKGKQLGQPVTRYDIYAPIEADGLEVSYEQSYDLVMEVFGGFDPRFAEMARRVFDEQHVDALPRENKRGGAFCATVQSTMTPYVLLNHTPDARSVSTMAHELGHAVHSMLAADRHPLVAHAPLPLAETASIFSELLLHHHLVKKHPETARALANERLGDLYATIQRQAYFALFEKEAHPMIIDGQPTARVSESYMNLLREQFGEMEIPEQFGQEWMLIPHFANVPFYVSSYTFGALLSLSLYQQYAQDEGFKSTILAILSAGGSREPQALLKSHGLDITRPDFWRRGFEPVEEMLAQLEG